MTTEEQLKEYGLHKNMKCVIIKEPETVVEVIHIDENLPHPTTCRVKDENNDTWTTWTNKLSPLTT